MTESSSSGSRAAEIDLCRVSVIGVNTQLDVALPANVPIATFVPELVALIESRDPVQADGEDGPGLREPRHWTLAKLGREAIAPSRTLAEADVYDGELLVLRAVGAKESPALFDDVIDAVSRLTAEGFRGWSPSSARSTGLLVAVVAAVLALLVFAGGRGAGFDLAAPFLATGAALGAAVAAAIAARKYGDESTATWLGATSIALFAGGAALFVPGDLGSPQLLLGFSVMLVAAVLLYRALGTAATVCAAAITIAVFGGVAAAIALVWDPATLKIAAGLLVAGIALISTAPRLAAVAARLPVPPVPTAGGAIDPADHEPRPTIEGIGAIGATALPSAAGLGTRAKAANSYQTGMLFGCATAAIVGALGTAQPWGDPGWPGCSLAVIAAIILASRGRSFADLTQAGTLIGAGATIVIGLLAGFAVGGGSLVPGALLLGFAALVVVFGVIGPHLEITPVTRRMSEIFEYLLICAVIPLVLWVMDVYSMARNL
ncbi:type VII secretion integral membrane protein EccD [Nocardia sp. NPDC055029]